MSRIEFTTPRNATKLLDEIYESFQRRVMTSPSEMCPVEMTRAFLETCHAQTCGKCSPCRIGLRQLINLLTDVLEGTAEMETLETMTELARSIYESADCAIGYDAGLLAYKSLIAYRDDFEEHIRNGRCICTYDNPMPCAYQCPAHVDIPGYIALVKEGRFDDAMKLIRKDNPFPVTCAYICEHPCEKNCRRGTIDAPVNIRGLKKAASEQSGPAVPPPNAPSTGKKVAVIGGGPAGLSAAYFLQLMGHATTVYEKEDKLGGMLRFGIPNYRLPKDQLDRDIDFILASGINVEYNSKIETQEDIKKLHDEYDAVLLTVGACNDKKMGIPGEDANGVHSAVEILNDVGNGKYLDLTGQEVCIVGGGNVSMDAARTALRLGASKVNLLYRRRIVDMTALDSEIEGAIAEGVNIQTLCAPFAVETDENNNVTGLTVTPQMISYIKDGRAGIKPSGEDNFTVPCSTIIVAIGQSIESDYFASYGLEVSRGRLVTGSKADISSIPGFYACGDCATGPKTVVSAIGAAKVMAANVDEYLGFRHRISCDVDIPAPTSEDRKPMGRVEIRERDSAVRVKDWDGIEMCISANEACQEAGRCLRCDHYGYGLFRGGREHTW